MLKNFKLTIEYDGSGYQGWQRQTNGPTVQGEIEKALMSMTGEKVGLIGSGRTDAGVHAFGQVANFHCDTALSTEVFQKGLNSLLPEDIVITECKQVPEKFHARYDVKSKSYCYRILNRTLPAAIFRQYAWHIRKKLDLDITRSALRHIIGTKNREIDSLRQTINQLSKKQHENKNIKLEIDFSKNIMEFFNGVSSAYKNTIEMFKQEIKKDEFDKKKQTPRDFKRKFQDLNTEMKDYNYEEKRFVPMKPAEDGFQCGIDWDNKKFD